MPAQEESLGFFGRRAAGGPPVAAAAREILEIVESTAREFAEFGGPMKGCEREQ